MRRGAGTRRMDGRGEERIRSFVAVDLDAAVLDNLRRLQAELTRVPADVRWVRPGGMHVTLKFLGAVAPSLLAQVHAALRETLREVAAMTLAVRGLGAFPAMRRPRVVWAGLVGDGLAELAARVEAALAPLGFAAEGRAFTPHVTLGRVNGTRGWPALAEVIERHREDDFGTTVVNAVAVYRSLLHPEGAQYAVLWTVPLASSIVNDSRLG